MAATKSKQPKEKKVKKTKPVKQKSLEDILFDCRNSLRGRAQMSDKRDLLLTLVFLKFIYDRFISQQEKIKADLAKRLTGEPNPAMIERMLANPVAYAQDGVFFLTDDTRWDKLVSSEPKHMAVNFDNAISLLENIETGKDSKGNPLRPLRNALPQQIFTKTALEPGVLKEVVDNVNQISSERFGDADLIGRVYEYFLQAFSINQDKEEGEFYTPHSIVQLIAELIEPYNGTLYDPCCGSGGMFIQSMKLVQAHGGNTKQVNIYGQESEPATYRLAKMNLAVRGMSYDLGEKAASTFTDDQHKDKAKYGGGFDFIMANPPFNLKRWGGSSLSTDSRWKGYGVPPASNANYGWILHILDKLKPMSGRAGFLLANGALDDGDTKEIRKQLIEKDKVEAIIVLPREMFYSTDISVTLWILNNNKRGGVDKQSGRVLRNREHEVLFIDLRTWNTHIYEKKYVKFTDEQIAEVKRIYNDWQTKETAKFGYAAPELYCAARTSDIEERDYSLVPSRYIQFVDRDTELDYDEVLKQSGKTITDLLRRQAKNAVKLQEALKLLKG